MEHVDALTPFRGERGIEKWWCSPEHFETTSPRQLASPGAPDLPVQQLCVGVGGWCRCPRVHSGRSQHRVTLNLRGAAPIEPRKTRQQFHPVRSEQVTPGELTAKHCGTLCPLETCC
eukprot:COSAG02_NODE_754_length_17578_cov_97.544825_9_plen_117_part_00